MNCKYKVNIKDIQYNYKVKMEEIQSKYKFNIFCRGYDDSDIKGKINDMYNAWPKVTGEGETITLNDTVSATMPLGLKGNTYQEGTPTPDTPQEVHVVSGDNEVEVCGKNLVNISSDNQIIYTSSYGNFTLSNGTITTSGNTLVGYKVKVKPNTQYTQSTNTNLVSPGTHAIRIREYTTEPTNWNDNFIQQTSLSVSGTGTKYQTITTSTTTKWILYAVYSTATGDTFSDMQLEYGSNATSYIPYQAPTTYPINLPEGMFMGWIGNYQDYFYKQDKKWYLEKKIGEVAYTGAVGESWVLDSAGAGQFEILVSGMTRNPLYSNRFGYKLSYQTTGKPYLRPGNNKLFAEMGTEILPEISTNALKTWLSTHNTEVYYVLATPVITEITDTTLISQLEALQKAESYTGQTNISQVNNDAPFIITASTLKDLSSLGTSTVSTLNTANVNRLQTPSISPSLNLNNLELNNEDLELNNLEETIEETPEER